MSAADRNRPRFSLDDSHDETSDAEERPSLIPPRIVVEPALASGEAERENEASRDEPDERHVDFAVDPVSGRDVEGVDPASIGDRRRELELEDEGTGYPPRPSSSTPDSTANAKPSRRPTSTISMSRLRSKVEGITPMSFVPESFAWVPSKLNWKGLRPVVRSTVAGWCGLLLILAHPSQVALGRAGFLVLVVSIISPAAVPIANQIEQTFFQFLLVSISWAWSTLAIAIAHAARSQYRWSQTEFQNLASQPYLNQGLSATEITNLVTDDIYNGRFLEPASSAVCGIFLGVGCGFFLWLRGYLGPSPALFGCIFAIILQIISLTLGVLFPYPFYSIGLTFFLPFAAQHAITLACSVLVFPETLAHQFSDRTIATLTPLRTVIQRQAELLQANPRTVDWLEFASIKTTTNAAMTSLAGMNAAEANLTREVSFARVNGKDLTKVLQKMRVLTARTTGFVRFYDVVSKHLHRDYSDAQEGQFDHLTIHVGRSAAPSPAETPGSTRPPSPERSRLETKDSKEGAHSAALAQALDAEQKRQQSNRRGSQPESIMKQTAPPRSAPAYVRHRSAPLIRNGSPSHHSSSSLDLAREARQHSPKSTKPRSKSRNRHGNRASHVSLSSLLHDVLHPHVDIKPVGVVESMAYADLEDYLSNPRDEEHIEEIVRLLGTTSEDLLAVNDTSIGILIDIIHRSKATENTWSYLRRKEDPQLRALLEKAKEQLESLRSSLRTYRDDKRLDVLRPFGKLFDPYGSGLQEPGVDEGSLRTPSHRGLFWAFSYQSALLNWTEALLDVFEFVISVEEKRVRPRLWFPDWSKARFDKSDGQAEQQDEDPDADDNLDVHAFTAPRHPDYRPPKTSLQLLGVRLHKITDRITRRDVLFGVKAALVMGLSSMPAYFQSTSLFFQRERGVWVVVMVALTTTQFVGDTIFGFVLRVGGTLGGAIYGLLLWSIAAQKGRGNPYAAAATCAVGFFPLFFWRVHVMPPIRGILAAVTTVLVFGYSWQNAHYPTPTSIGYGWPIAWRRFVCVLIGISIAFIWTYVPPSTTQKVSIRRTHSRVVDRLGIVLASIISFANVKNGPRKAPKTIVKNIGALRTRLAKASAASAMTRYEPSLSGPWPIDQYTALSTLQMEILDLFAELAAVLSLLDDKWTAALLHRTQLSNPYFLQDLFSTIQLISSSLYHGQPLPMIYNPLLEQFLNPPEAHEAGRPYAYDVVLGSDDIEGIPSHVNLDVICSIEYMRFSTGVSAIYAIVNRLDRLMFVTKSLVGENYLLYGLDLSQHHPTRKTNLHDADDSRRTSLDHDSPV